MMTIENQTLEFVRRLQMIYLEQRDIETVISLMTPDIVWYGIGAGESGKGIDSIAAHLRAENENFHNKLTVRDSAFETIPLSEDACMASGFIRVEEDVDGLFQREIDLRLSLLCVRREGRLWLRQVHESVPNADQAEDEYFPSPLPPDAARLLQKMLEDKSREIEERNRDLKTLTDNIPGGMFRCLFDERLTLLQLSDGFLDLFGYTREEIEERFHNSFWEMLDPRDREPTLIEVRRQLEISNRKEIEYRVVCKDGRSLWVMDKGQLVPSDTGPDSFCCILIDVTNTKKAQEELRLSLERHQIIMDQTNDILFEWNIPENRLTFTANWEKRFGYPPLVKSGLKGIPEARDVHPEDLPRFEAVARRVLNGEPYAEEELRILKDDGKYIWCQIRATTQYDSAGVPMKAVGIIIDIDSQKKQTQKLQEKAERDTLTKLYNKGTIQSRIDRCIQHNSDEPGALMIIDIDNFKQINDVKGHLFGDAVLTEIAAILQRKLRSTDMIGRVGGDEFMVFLRSVRREEDVHEKAKQIIKAFHSILKAEKDGCRLSCSIGIALFPAQAGDFKELFRRADHALYQAKGQGKNQYLVYRQGEDDGAYAGISSGMHTAEMRTAISQKIDSDDNMKNLSSRLVEYVFRILYKSIDIEAAVDSLLEIVGRQFDVSRAYIFENTEDDRYCSNTFEWCNEGVNPEIDNLQMVCYEQDLGGNYLSNFNENGVFYCCDIAELPPKQYAILKPQGIKAMLQVAIWDGASIFGYVGFDECRNNRMWTQEQIDALAFISQIISTFLLKKRTQDRLEQTAEGLRTALDNQNSWIYVVEPDTYRLLYINKKTAELVPDAALGDCCYRAFFHRDSPCEHCSARGVGGNQPNCTLEVYNEILKVWSSADASRICWNGRDAWLLTCHDITSYKDGEK
jgi:diguanylate cyclase (GGDEF)-like protein/PAS domain S-box-containing protein